MTMAGIGQLLWIHTLNLLLSYEASRKPPSERPLYSDTCLTSYCSTSAIPASHAYRIAAIEREANRTPKCTAFWWAKLSVLLYSYSLSFGSIPCSRRQSRYFCSLSATMKKSFFAIFLNEWSILARSFIIAIASFVALSMHSRRIRVGRYSYQ